MYHSMQRVVSPRTCSEKKGENVRRDEKEEEEEEEGLFKANAVNEEDPECDRATPA